MSTPPAKNTEMIVEIPEPHQDIDNDMIEEIASLLETVPKICKIYHCQNQCRVVTTDQEGLVNSFNPRNSEYKSVFGQSDILSIAEDKDDSEKGRSEPDMRNRVIKRCFNVKCLSTKDVKKLKSKAFPGKFRNFCKSCHQLYSNCQFCEFCEQVYDDSAFNEQDDNKWMGCDTCQRWNHVQCQYQNRNKNAYQIKHNNYPYLCIECSDKKSNKNESKKAKPASKQQDYYFYQKPPRASKRTQRVLFTLQKQQQYFNPNLDCINIFRKPKQINLYLDSFLHSVNNFKLAIPDSQIKEDLRKISGLNNNTIKNYSKNKGKW